MIKVGLPTALVYGFERENGVYEITSTVYKEENLMEKVIVHSFTGEAQDFFNHFSDVNPDVIVTMGGSKNLWHHISKYNTHNYIISKWIHSEEILTDEALANLIATEATNWACDSLNAVYNSKELPFFSVFTGAYKTDKDRILRSYNSLVSQTYKNWEWVVVDDSPEGYEDTWSILTELAKKDYRVKVHRILPVSGGNIGLVKNRAASLSNGNYLLEMDHDDALISTCFEDLKKAIQEFPDAGFFYTNVAEPYEDGQMRQYTKTIGSREEWYANPQNSFVWAYGGHEWVEADGKKYLSHYYPNINPKTIRFNIGMPNHARVWNRDVYNKVSKHNKFISVADDYELIVRTFLETTMVHVPKLLYLQYNNRNSTVDNNRKDINRKARLIKDFYDKQIHERIIELGYHDFEWKEDLQRANLLQNDMGDLKYFEDENILNKIAMIKETKTPPTPTFATKLNNINENIKNQYQNNNPFNHIVLDDFVEDKNYLKQVLSEFDEYNLWGWDSSKYSSENQVKKFFSPWCDENILDMPTKTKKLIDYLNSDEVIKKIEYLTGINGLKADSFLLGGGMHRIDSSGKLSIHADSSKHAKTNLYRRVNLLLYLNENWQESWGGTLQLWDKTLTNMDVEIQPVFNRAVLFSTTKDSYHGHPHPLNTPEGVSRYSIALYYYSEDMPSDQKAEFDSAQWVEPVQNIESNKIQNKSNMIKETKTRPTLAFATMCKNEEHVIGQVLDAVAPYIDYLVVADNGSTDRTLEIVQEFMDRTGIPGEIHRDEWFGFDVNKNMMMEYVHGKTDYVLHLDADDILAGDFSFNFDDAGFDNYFMTMKRGTSTWKATVIYDNRLRWKFCGAAHTIIKCLDKPNGYSTGDLSSRGWVIADGVGSRAFDPKKFLYDAERLTNQFWNTLTDDPDDLFTRSVFYTAQSYMDYGQGDSYEQALKWNKLYLKLKNTWIEEAFEAQMRISLCMMNIEGYTKNQIVEEMEKAITIFPDRAEPRVRLGKYLNKIGDHHMAYYYLNQAKEMDLDTVKEKYILFVDNTAYGKYINDELSVACYWTGRYDRGLQLINEIINDVTFINDRPRLVENINHFTNKMNDKQTYNA